MNRYLIFVIKDIRFLSHIVVLAAALSLGWVLAHSIQQQSQLLKKLNMEKDLVKQTEAMRDKFLTKLQEISLSTAALNHPQVKVEAVLYRQDGSCALINGVIYKVGDSFGDYQLKSILPNSLTLLNIHTQVEETIAFNQVPKELLKTISISNSPGKLP